MSISFCHLDPPSESRQLLDGVFERRLVVTLFLGAALCCVKADAPATVIVQATVGQLVQEFELTFFTVGDVVNFVVVLVIKAVALGEKHVGTEVVQHKVFHNFGLDPLNGLFVKCIGTENVGHFLVGCINIIL
jgi:hypothetical protein